MRAIWSTFEASGLADRLRNVKSGVPQQPAQNKNAMRLRSLWGGGDAHANQLMAVMVTVVIGMMVAVVAVVMFLVVCVRARCWVCGCVGGYASV